METGKRHILWFEILWFISSKWAFWPLILSHLCQMRGFWIWTRTDLMCCAAFFILASCPGSPTHVGLCHPWQIHTYVSAAGDRLLPGPLALCHVIVQFMSRKESAGVLQVCGPNWHVCEADYSCFGIGSETAWILWLISFSGKEAVTRVSCCPGWVRSWCSAGSQAGLHRHEHSGPSGRLTAPNKGRAEAGMKQGEAGLEKKPNWSHVVPHLGARPPPSTCDGYLTACN